MNQVLVPAARLPRWVDNFEVRHGRTELVTRDGALAGAAEDGSHFTARLPFGAAYDGAPDPRELVAAAEPPAEWGVLLVRKGGFAVARLAVGATVASKVGQRHVQGRTKAGGQSQQRFARRRNNQARQAYEAAAEHAARILGGTSLVVVGGDRAAVAAVLADPRLRHVQPAERWLPVPDPRRAVLEAAVEDACALAVEVADAGPVVR